MMYGKPPMQTKPGPMPAQRPPMGYPAGYGMPMQQVGQPLPAQRPVNALGMGMQPRPQMYNALAMYGRR